MDIFIHTCHDNVISFLLEDTLLEDGAMVPNGQWNAVHWCSRHGQYCPCHFNCGCSFKGVLWLLEFQNEREITLACGENVVSIFLKISQFLQKIADHCETA